LTASYQLTATAEDELGAILLYVAEHDGIGRALLVHGKFAAAFEALAGMPGMGSKRPQLTGDCVRWHTVFRWIVLYDGDSPPLTILRVIHGARHLDRIFRPDS